MLIVLLSKLTIKIAIGESVFLHGKFWDWESSVIRDEVCKINRQSLNVRMAIISWHNRDVHAKFGHVVNDANGDGWRKWSRAEGWRQVKVLSSPSLRPLSVSALINRNWRPREASHIARSVPHASSSSQLHNRSRRASSVIRRNLSAEPRDPRLHVAGIETPNP